MAAAHVVLVIEDSEEVREAIVGMLTGQGFLTIAAEDDDHAFALLEAPVPPPGLIVIDVGTPVLDAGTFHRALAREHPALADVPIIVITGRGRDHVGVFPSPPNLAQPFSAEALLVLVRDHCLPRR